MDNFLEYELFGDATAEKLQEARAVEQNFAKSTDPVAQFLERSRLEDFLGKSDGGFDPGWSEEIGMRKISPSTIPSEPRGVPSPHADGVFTEQHGEVTVTLEYRGGQLVSQVYEYPDRTRQTFEGNGVEVGVDSVAEERALADAPGWTIAKKLGITSIKRQVINGTRWAFCFDKGGDLVDARIY